MRFLNKIILLINAMKMKRNVLLFLILKFLIYFQDLLSYSYYFTYKFNNIKDIKTIFKDNEYSKFWVMRNKYYINRRLKNINLFILYIYYNSSLYKKNIINLIF